MEVVERQLSGIEAFLALPEFRPPFDYYDGRAIQKMSPRLRHTIIQQEMFVKLIEHARPAKLGNAYIELRVTLKNVSVVFDVSFFLQGRIPKVPADDRADITTAPDLVIEVLSPGQGVGELKKKLRAGIRSGVRLGWLFNPKRKEVLILRKGQRPEILKPGDTLTGGEVLSDFALPVAEIFGWLD